MLANNSVEMDPKLEEEEPCVLHAPDSACEKLLHKLATHPRAAEAIGLIPLLCPKCSQKLSELLTTRGLGAR